MKIALLEEDMEITRLHADFERRVIRTECGDSYMDYEISFDDFIKFAKLVDKEDTFLNCMSKTEG